MALQKVTYNNTRKANPLKPNPYLVHAEQFNPLVDVVNQVSSPVIKTIVVTAASATTDFTSLIVGDRTVLIPAIAGNSVIGTVVTTGTLPSTPAVGDFVLVIRTIN